MTYKQIPSEYLATVLDYDPRTGILYWRSNPLYNKSWNSKYAGNPITCVGNHGYICFNLSFNGRKYHLLAHRAVLCLLNDRWPDEVDHINRDRIDNRECNLRECSSLQNKANIGVRRNNKIGLKGVSRGKDKIDGTHRYFAFSRKGGNSEYLGTYPTPEQAKDAYNAFFTNEFGDFARL